MSFLLEIVGLVVIIAAYDLFLSDKVRAFGKETLTKRFGKPNTDSEEKAV